MVVSLIYLMHVQLYCILCYYRLWEVQAAKPVFTVGKMLLLDGRDQNPGPLLQSEV